MSLMCTRDPELADGASLGPEPCLFFGRFIRSIVFKPLGSPSFTEGIALRQHHAHRKDPLVAYQIHNV